VGVSAVHIGGTGPLYRQSAALPEADAAKALRAAQDAPAWRMLHAMLALSIAWWLLLVALQYVGVTTRVGLLVVALGPIAAMVLWKRYQWQMRRWHDEYWGGCHRCGAPFQGNQADSLHCPACGERWRLRLPPRTGTHPRGGATLTVWIVALAMAGIAFACSLALGTGARTALEYAQYSALAGVLAGLSIHGRRLLARDAPWVFD
jgi:hypothetical protein